MKGEGITAETLDKIKKFMKNMKEPAYKSNIAKTLHVNIYSLDFALTKIKHKTYKDGRIK
jgi:hypothetical protein